jgi:cytochrome c biogenesis protein CcdA
MSKEHSDATKNPRNKRHAWLPVLCLFTALLLTTGSAAFGDSVPVAHGLEGNGRTVLRVFLKPGCSSCDRIHLEMKRLRTKYPDKVLCVFHDIRKEDDQVYYEALAETCGLNEKERLKTPAIFCGRQAWIGEEKVKNRATFAHLEKLVRDDAVPDAVIDDAALERAKKRLFGRFEAFSWAAIILAGLLDGVNPCAFVTIIFLLSYLNLLRYRRSEAAWVGISFAFAVFVTYFAVGLGLLGSLSVFGDFPAVRTVVRWGAIMLAFLVGLLNLRDFVLVRKGKTEDMELKLSDSLRKRINTVIRSRLKMRHLVGGAFLIGVSVSLLELACTGQVYLPVIMYVVNSGVHRSEAMLLLMAYNLAFIVPLLFIFLLFLLGVGEKSFSSWLGRHAAWIKLATGILFISVGIVLFLMK